MFILYNLKKNYNLKIKGICLVVLIIYNVKKLFVEYYFVIFRNIVLFRIIYINERDIECVLLDIIINYLLRVN